jgi:nuclear transport factor 2 (NTF2) superfamily protein
MVLLPLWEFRVRNLNEYPLTRDEVSRVLNRKLEEESNKRLIGGIDGYALTLVERFIHEYAADFDKFLEMEQS